MIPEEIKSRIENASKDASHPESAKAFMELGYSLASSEIEALKKEVERVKQLLENEYKVLGAAYFDKHGFTYADSSNKANEAWTIFKANNNL
jgi:hypothetical protein